jgi:hypothetical protein
MKDGDFQATIFPGTGTGLQAAIDSLAGGKGKVAMGPGTLQVSTAVSIHGGCHLEGAGPGLTVIKRQTGTLTGGDAAYSGNLLLVTPFGSNGVNPSGVGQAQADIVVSELTLDGNQSAFAINPATPRHMGIYATWVDKMTITNIEVKNFLQTGIQLDTCRDSFITDSNIHDCGQYASASARNGISIIDNQNGTGNDYSRRFVIDGCVINTVNDAGIDLTNMQDVTVSNCILNNCGNGCVEIEGHVAGSTTIRNLRFSNITAYNATSWFATVGADPGVGISLFDISIENVVCNFHSTLHTNGAVAVGINAPVKRFRMANCSFYNINSKGDAATNGVYFGANSTITDGEIRDCLFEYPSLNSNGDCVGINVRGSIYNLQISDTVLRNVSGVGVNVGLVASGGTLQDVTISNVTVDQGNSHGFSIYTTTGGTGPVSRVIMDGCIVRDSCQLGTSSAAFNLSQSTNAAGDTLKDVTIRDCHARRVSGVGTMTQGVRFFQNGAGTLDTIYCGSNIFDSLTGSHYVVASGTPTNVRLEVRAGKGSNITAAATIFIPPDGDVFHVTGNTNITNGITVNPWDNGRTVKLIFEGTPTVSDTGTSKLAGNFVAAGTTNDFDVLTLTCDGTNWYEVARSVN